MNLVWSDLASRLASSVNAKPYGCCAALTAPTFPLEKSPPPGRETPGCGEGAEREVTLPLVVECLLVAPKRSNVYTLYGLYNGVSATPICSIYSIDKKYLITYSLFLDEKNH
jgi:hypothetical protein